MRKFLTFAIILSMTGCATQRYGRLTEVSDFEQQELTCREIRVEHAKAAAFTKSVQSQRAETTGAHVLGFIGDFGIGNSMEGREAEASGTKRVGQLRDLYRQKGCTTASAAR